MDGPRGSRMTCSLASDAHPSEDRRVTQWATVAGTTLSGLVGVVKLVGLDPCGSQSKIADASNPLVRRGKEGDGFRLGGRNDGGVGVDSGSGSGMTEVEGWILGRGKG